MPSYRRFPCVRPRDLERLRNAHAYDKRRGPYNAIPKPSTRRWRCSRCSRTYRSDYVYIRCPICGYDVPQEELQP